MDKRFVTLRTYYSPTEARLEKGRLEAEGIEAFLADEETISMDWLLNGAVGGIKLQVTEEDAEKALEVLESEGPSSGEKETLPEGSTWKCEKCGRDVSHELDSCPNCDQGSEPLENSSLKEAKPEAEGDEENLAEELATRAFRVAVVGIFLLPLLCLPHLYSLYLLFKYFGREDAVKNQTQKRVYIALAIDGIALAFWIWLILSVVFR